MREIKASSTLTIYHDGQFWVGMLERVEEGQLSVSRIIFGAEPSNEEVQQLICARWNRLRFTRPIVQIETPKIAANPKRRQREASQEMKRHGPSTKAQQALSEEREASAAQRASGLREQRESERQERYELRQRRRKQKHRGK